MVKRKSVAQIPLGGTLLQRTPVNTGIDIPSANLIHRLNRMTGENSGALGRANYEVAIAGRKQASMTADQVEARRRQPFDMNGEGLYANPHTGHGLYAGGGLYANPSSDGKGLIKHYRMKKHLREDEIDVDVNKMRSFRRERGSIGINGNLLHQPQATIPQPYSVNFVWGNTLPPYYQKYNRG